MRKDVSLHLDRREIPSNLIETLLVIDYEENTVVLVESLVGERGR